MARTLWALREARTPNVVLPAFGAGAMQNDPIAAARIYADLLALPHAPFRGAFARVVFAVPGKYFHDFKDEFETLVFAAELEQDLVSDRRRP